MSQPLTVTEAIAVYAEAAVVRPGDTLLLRYQHHAKPQITAEHAAKIKSMLKERLPDVDIVIVIADGMVVYRPKE